MERQRQRRTVDGFLLLDKPYGFTSNRALQRVKRLFDARKAGHTGSLDPLATGMLPICFGTATRVAQYALAADKSYAVTGRLGVRTDTDDADGRIIEQGTVPELTLGAVKAVLEGYVGVSEQTPPMYSALKHEGQRLYELARRGIEVEREARPISIRSIELGAFEPPDIEMRVVCSKGTYIRTLVADIAASLGTIGHVAALRRLTVGSFVDERMWTLEELEVLAIDGWTALDRTLRPTDTALLGWPEVVLDGEALSRVRHGQTIKIEPPDHSGCHRIYSADRVFVGIGVVNERGELAPRRILS